VAIAGRYTVGSVCLGAAMLLVRVRPPVAFPAALVAIALAFGARTAVRTMDWRDADAFYPKLVETAPQSARAWYSLGVLHVARGRDAEALPAFDRAIAIFPAYPEAFNNRGNVLVSLGRLEEAKASYREALRFDPGHQGAAASLLALEQGITFTPERRRM
jgi:tetratricopeptide (TPR) repeat protein